MKNYPILANKKEECCGCAACFAVCPQNAITMEEDDEGFEYPKIDYRICISCFACIGVCQYKIIK